MKKHKKGGKRAALSETEKELLAASALRESAEEQARASYRYLRMAPSSRDFSFETGKEIYSYSDSRAFAEFSDRERERMWKKPAGMVLIVLSAVFLVWFVFSFIYRMTTEADKVGVLLSMLPSLLVVAAADTIMLVSAFGGWGKLVRFVFRHNLARGRDAFSRRNLANLQSDYRRADERKPVEIAISVCEHAVELLLLGEKYVFERDAVRLKVSLSDGALSLTFLIDELTLDFPLTLPKSEYVPLKKAFRERLSVERKDAVAEQETDKRGRKLYGGYSLGSVITSTLFACLILAAAILLIVAHYKWAPSIPPFLGIFFVGAAGLALCNTFHHIPIVKEVALPLIFSLILTVIPLWINIWIETELYHNAFTFVYFATHCTPFGAGFTFLSCMGVYGLIFSTVKLIDYVRFGSSK